MRATLSALVLACAPLVACGSDSDVEAAFCDILATGPAQAATATNDDDGPEVFVDGSRVDITLLDDGSGSFSGRVRFTPDETGTFAMGLGADIPIVVSDTEGNALPFESVVMGAACSELAVRQTVALQLQTYIVELGPSPVADVAFVAEESDDDL
ncbi:MAG: hypothetical protein AAF602_03740 [Myxococcota bacterium]